MEFAGAWYPAGREACERQILDFWAAAGPDAADAPAAERPAPRFGVAPHAGWLFSGALAARVHRALAPDPAVRLAIVLGGHLRASDPLVAMVEGAWETPFGAMPVHEGFRADLQALAPLREETALRGAADNSTELQLPFLRYRYPQAELLALRVPPGPQALALGRRLADYLARTGLAAVGIASTDLTHYGPGYGFEPRGRGPQALAWVREENDPAFLAALAGGDGERLLAVSQRCRNACSAGAVAALNEVARRQGLRFEPLGYATSDDVHPGQSLNFVGYLGGVWR